MIFQDNILSILIFNILHSYAFLVRNRSAGNVRREIDGGAGHLRGYSVTRAHNRKAKRTSNKKKRLLRCFLLL